MKNFWTLRRKKRVRDERLTRWLYGIYIRCGGDLRRFEAAIRKWIKGAV